MARLRSAMDSAFWDQHIASPQTLDGYARSIPGDPFPLDGARASRALRIQQLAFLRNGFPLGIIPSYSPTPHKDLGSFSLQSLFLKLATSDCWLGLVGQFRPKKLISAIRSEFRNAEDSELPAWKDVGKHFLDKSVYSLSVNTQLSLTATTSLLLSKDWLGEKKTPRYKMMLLQELPDHDITLEAAWPALFIDHKGGYWDVPESISLDMTSLVTESGFQYHFGIHKNSGRPQPVNALNAEVPSALMSGLCAKAAFCYEKTKDFWRRKQTKRDIMVKRDKGWFWRPSYDEHLSEPHAAISGLIGGTCAAWFGGGQSSASVESPIDGNNSLSARKRSPLNADLFGSVCYTFQHGQFKDRYGDLTRVDARLDICSASALAKKVFSVFSSSLGSADNPLSSPRLNLILQQQVAGPIALRIDSKFSLGSSAGNQGPHMEDLIYSLTYSFRLLGTGKAVAWYSPKRKEGMIELRAWEF